MRSNIKLGLTIAAGAAVVILGIWGQIYIHNQCGWERSLLWGKSVNALYFMGYCND